MALQLKAVVCDQTVTRTSAHVGEKEEEIRGKKLNNLYFSFKSKHSKMGVADEVIWTLNNRTKNLLLRS